MKKPAAFATGFFLVLQRRFELRLFSAPWAVKPFQFDFARRLAICMATADDGKCPEFCTSSLFTLTYYLKKPAAFATGFFLVLQRRFELRLFSAPWAVKPFQFDFARRLAICMATADDGKCPEFYTYSLFTLTYYLKKPVSIELTGFFLVLQRRFELRTPCLKGRCSAY